MSKKKKKKKRKRKRKNKKSLPFMGFHRAPLQNGFYHARYTSNFKLEDIKMFLRKCCYQGQNFK